MQAVAHSPAEARSRPSRPHVQARARRDTSPAEKHRQRALFVRCQHEGDLAARCQLVERFLPLAQSLARRYDRRIEPFEDLLQVAYIGLVKAIDRFDVDRGNEFSSFAVPTILGELRRYFRGAGWAVHVPRSMQERVLDVARVVERLSNDLGSSPTPQQIAADMDLTVEEVLEASVAAAGHDTLSLDAPRRASGDDDATLADSVGGLDAGFDLVEHRPGIARALKGLPARERAILYLRFSEDLTQSEIGQRLRISQMHVSRLLRQALDRLRIVVGEG
jgi:RNA polymerase sigma-B factor